jgi:DNA-3-methyladenine glycosylase
MHPRHESAVPARLRRTDLPADTVALARFLIGKTLVHDLPEGRVAGRIVETEAYLPDDPACHAFIGQTRRNRSLFLERGHAYVYFSYGCWALMNVASETAGIGAGVLLRAIEPLEGIPIMEARRKTRRLLDLARGPGRLSAAMGIALADDGRDLCAPGPLWLGEAVRPPGKVCVSVRIGITRAADRQLRFFEAGNPFVSGPASLNRRTTGRSRPRESGARPPPDRDHSAAGTALRWRRNAP